MGLSKGFGVEAFGLVRFRFRVLGFGLRVEGVKG